MSVPCEPTPASSSVPSLPVGVQIIAPPLYEMRMFALGAALEAAFGRAPRPHPFQS